MLKSESIAAISAALFAAQPNIKGAMKDAKNPHLGKNYADLGSVYEACKGALHEQGIMILQHAAISEYGVSVTTTLMHPKSGEWIANELAARPVKDDAQALGSTITYLRRYTLQTIAGVVSEDDDGHAASGKPPARTGFDNDPLPPRRETVKSPNPPPPPSAKSTSLKDRKERATVALIAAFGADKANAFVAEIRKSEFPDDLARVMALEALIPKEGLS